MASVKTSSTARSAQQTTSKPTANVVDLSTVPSKSSSITPVINLDLCYVCGKRHPPGCVLRASGCNLNPNIENIGKTLLLARPSLNAQKRPLILKFVLIKLPDFWLLLTPLFWPSYEVFSAWQRFPTSMSDHTSQHSPHGSWFCRSLWGDSSPMLCRHSYGLGTWNISHPPTPCHPTYYLRTNWYWLSAEKHY